MLLAGDPDPYACTFGVATDLASFSPQEHADHVGLAWVTSILDGQSDDLTFASATCRFGQDGGDDLIIDSDLIPYSGGSNTEKLPQNCAVLVRKNTSLGGRKNRGRLFIPSLASDSVVSMTGVIDPTAVATFQGRMDDFVDYLNTDPVTAGLSTPMVILHAPSVVLVDPTPVTSLTVQPMIATQRRRLRR
uniref:Uncharacterized protein n=1 Tax=uncultured prokaryote TaxID=198431 RepID=A0A0H5Q456_9ZZZZ|nr:hypothetical protein [uncultured prokaryote]